MIKKERKFEHGIVISIGELAKLCNVPRKTLIYYDQRGLINTVFKNEKGYRFYSTNQIPLLKLLLNLRKLDIPLKVIKEYLEDRSPQKFKKMILNQDIVIVNKIKELELAHENIQELAAFLDNVSNLKIGEIKSYEDGDRYIFVSEEILSDALFTDRMQLSCRYHEEFAKHFPNLSLINGHILDKERFLKDKQVSSKCFFTPTNKKVESEFSILLPKGNYVAMNFYGYAIKNTDLLFKKFMEFIKENDLKIISDFYITNLRKAIIERDSSKFVSEIKCRVEKIK